MKKKLRDMKNPLATWFWGAANRLVLAGKFRFIFIGGAMLPKKGPFILVSNHMSRWDGLILQRLVSRHCNYMVSPNELKGFQGSVLRSMGAFPADASYDLTGYVSEQFKKDEGLVVFPEGNIFRDGTTHPFKSGAARIALSCRQAGQPVQVIPVAIAYPAPNAATVAVGAAVELDEYLGDFAANGSLAIKSLSCRLHREVCFLRQSLGYVEEYALYGQRPLKSWVSISFKIGEEYVRAASERQTTVSLVRAAAQVGR